MKIAVLSPIAWRTPPEHYGPWESVASNITEGMVARGHDVTLYATGQSITNGQLRSVCEKGYEQDESMIPKVWESLHISALFEEADQYDLIHNNFDFLPLTYTGMTETPVVTTIHGFSSPGILPVYRKYDQRVRYVSISDADRAGDLHYTATVHHGIDISLFDFHPHPDDYLLFFGRIHPDKGVADAIKIAKKAGIKLIIAGIIQDQQTFDEQVQPELEEHRVEYIGSVGPDKRNTVLGGARALLHPIHFDEPFGLSVIESMACGTPVIAFNRGSMPEIIEPEHTGFLVDDVPQAVTAVQQLDQINREDCRRHAEQHFSLQRMIDNYENVYKRILQQ